VEDDGPGVALEEQERVFESFYRGDASANGKVKGSGLGLAIVREYVLAHQGHVFVVDPGKPGGRFRVRLPFDLTLSDTFAVASSQGDSLAHS
jgi:two-component system sensor histidine kinase GlrK